MRVHSLGSGFSFRIQNHIQGYSFGLRVWDQGKGSVLGLSLGSGLRLVFESDIRVLVQGFGVFRFRGSGKG